MYINMYMFTDLVHADVDFDNVDVDDVVVDDDDVDDDVDYDVDDDVDDDDCVHIQICRGKCTCMDMYVFMDFVHVYIC
jgi:hypothetical protein